MNISNETHIDIWNNIDIKIVKPIPDTHISTALGALKGIKYMLAITEDIRDDVELHIRSS